MFCVYANMPIPSIILPDSCKVNSIITCQGMCAMNHSIDEFVNYKRSFQLLCWNVGEKEPFLKTFSSITTTHVIQMFNDFIYTSKSIQFA